VTNSTTRTPSLVVVGLGPRGVICVERLGALLPGSGVECCELHLVEEYEPGAGKVWATDQGYDFPLLADFWPHTHAFCTSTPQVRDWLRQAMARLFVEGKLMTAGDFQLCWHTPGPEPPARLVEPFIYRLADKGIIPIEKSLRLLSDRARLAYLYLEKYDLDIELARRFPRETCLRWCVVPFDHMGKTLMAATANPYNKQAAAEIEQSTKFRVQWYLAAPADLLKILGKIFR